MENEFHKGRAFQLPVHISIPSMCKEGSVIFHLSRMYPTGWSSQELRTAEYNPELRREKESQQTTDRQGQSSSTGNTVPQVQKACISCCPKAGVWQMTTDKLTVSLVSAHSECE